MMSLASNDISYIIINNGQPEIKKWKRLVRFLLIRVPYVLRKKDHFVVCLPVNS